ncbi:MAG: hypothetical protein DRJ64_09305, partial [Thermoprotei archaeon]
ESVLLSENIAVNIPDLNGITIDSILISENSYRRIGPTSAFYTAILSGSFYFTSTARDNFYYSYIPDEDFYYTCNVEEDFYYTGVLKWT